MCLTHDDLAFILQGFPGLSDLTFLYTDVVDTPTQSFQHVGVKFFAAPTGPSLLSYFPSLTTLSTYNYERSHVTIPSTRIKDDITRNCPQLPGYYLQDNTGVIVLNFLTDIANNMSEVTYLHNTISSEAITAILLHQATLKVVRHFNFEHDFDSEKRRLPRSWINSKYLIDYCN